MQHQNRRRDAGSVPRTFSAPLRVFLLLAAVCHQAALPHAVLAAPAARWGGGVHAGYDSSPSHAVVGADVQMIPARTLPSFSLMGEFGIGGYSESGDFESVRGLVPYKFDVSTISAGLYAQWRLAELGSGTRISVCGGPVYSHVRSHETTGLFTDGKVDALATAWGVSVTHGLLRARVLLGTHDAPKVSAGLGLLFE